MMTYMGYSFEGWYSINDTLPEVAGVYLITNSRGAVSGGIVDVGETDNLKNRIPSHERRDCWARNSGLYLYLHREDNKDQRLAIEKVIRNGNNLPCGSV